MHDAIKKAGHYEVFSGDSLIGKISFNFDRKESFLEVPGEKELQNMLDRKHPGMFRMVYDSEKPLSQSIKELNEGKKLWKLFIIFALIFLASEIVMLRFWR